jgi:hypothetical protein
LLVEIDAVIEDLAKLGEDLAFVITVTSAVEQPPPEGRAILIHLA